MGGAADRRSDFRLTGAGDAGGYRRPLDAAAAEAAQLLALGWQPVGRRGAAAGRVVMDREAAEPSSAAVYADPYASSPLVVTDSTVPPMLRLRARLEGALGVRLGGGGAWGVGLAGGLEARDHRTSRSGVPRTVRLATPAVTVGATRELPLGGLRVGAYGRWLQSDETVLITPLAVPGTVLQLEGYAEPDPRVFPELAYYRRAERAAHALGLGMSGRAAGAAWVAYGERTRRRDEQSSDLREGRAVDAWRADGHALGAAVQRPLLGARLLVTLRARYSALAGGATRADLPGDVFRGTESAFAASGDVRLVPRGRSPWAAGVTVSTARERRERQDFVAELGSDVRSWAPGVAVEVARAVGAGVSVSAGYARAFYVPTSVIPNPDSLGPVYRRLVAPELSLHATAASPWAAAVAASRRAGAGATLWVRACRERLAASADEGALPLAPGGARTLWGVALGATLHP